MRREREGRKASANGATDLFAEREPGICWAENVLSYSHSQYHTANTAKVWELFRF